MAGRTNTAIEAGWLEIGDQRVAEGRIENSANGGRVDFTWTLTTGSAGEAVVKFKHRLGREIEALRFPVEVLEDMAPEVVLLSPIQRDFKVRADEVLPLKYEIAEDFSVAKLAVEVDAGDNAKALLDEALPVLVPHSKPQVFRGEAPVSIGELRSRFSGANEIRMRVRAEDARPADVKGPGVGYSEWVTVHIDQNAESLARQELREEHEGAKKTIEEAIRATREGREKMDWHRGEIRNPELSDNARKNLKKSAEQLAEAEAKLVELAKQMKEGVHANKSDEVEKAAETVAKAREELENSQLQDDPGQRESKLDQARNDARETERQLEEIRNAMDRDREKIEDLARVMDLAQKQQEIARQAEENIAKQDPAKAMPDDWKNQQRQLEEAIKQQLRERPEGKAEALKAQAEQAKALADQARQTAKAQENLEQQTKEISPEELRKALAEEQAKIAQEANAELDHAREARNDLADTLPEATAAADAAKEQIEKGETEPAAKSANEAAKAMKDAARKAGENQADNGKPAAEKLDQAAQAENLADLAERQEQVAEAMSELSKGNAAEAMKKLEAEQADAANELAQQIETMPQLDGNGAMQEAKNNSNQGDQQAEEAAKKGQEGQLAEASKQHGESGRNFEKAAQALDKAAEEFNRSAQEMAAHQSSPQRANVSPADLAEAFEQASQAASNPQAAEAAAQAASAAKALAQAAEAGRKGMQGKSQSPGANPPPGGPPGQMAGNKPEEGPRQGEADPGVPPELAKLGISSEDWAKIQASLKSDVGASEGGQVPEEYRGLVKGYFESMSNKPNK